MSDQSKLPDGSKEVRNLDNSGQPTEISRISGFQYVLGLFRISPVEWVVLAQLIADAVGVGWPQYAGWRAALMVRQEIEGIAAIRTGIASWAALNSEPPDTAYPSALDSCPTTVGGCRPFAAILKEPPPGGWTKTAPMAYKNAAGRVFYYTPSTGSWIDSDPKTTGIDSLLYLRGGDTPEVNGG